MRKEWVLPRLRVRLVMALGRLVWVLDIGERTSINVGFRYHGVS